MYRDLKLEEELCVRGLDAKAAALAFGDLTAYLGRPIEAIAEEYWRYRATDDVAAQERVARATDDAPVIAYYQQTPHYLYELSYWEATGDKQAWFRVVAQACRRYGLRRTLDLGGGVGGLSVFLRMRGIQSDHLDIAGKTSEYARWRFARRGLGVQAFDAATPAGWPRGPYDAVVAWDVLEHIFDLEGAVRQAAGVLRPRGWFISKSTFADAGGQHLHIHLAKHAEYVDVAKLNRMVSQFGFQFRGQLKPGRVSRLLRACGVRHAVAGIRLVPRLKHGGNFLVHERVNGNGS